MITTIWKDVQPELRQKIGETPYETWFTNIQVKAANNNGLILQTPDDFFKNWIVDHYQDFICEVMQNKMGYAIPIEIVVEPDLIIHSNF
jgi:chromosomal replication initiator protein